MHTWKFLLLKIQMSTAFVIGLAHKTQAIDVEDEFSFYGDISSCVIPLGKRICFVKFKNRTDAGRAIERMDGERVDGAKIRVEWAKDKVQKQPRIDSRFATRRLVSRSRSRSR
jgi:RNA recognition motif-containing protein